MFRCYFCNQITPPKTTRHSVVIEVREKNYSARRRAPQKRGFRSRDRDEPIQDHGGSGREIIREVDACPECAAAQNERQPTMAKVERPVEEHEANVPDQNQDR